MLSSWPREHRFLVELYRSGVRAACAVLQIKNSCMKNIGLEMALICSKPSSLPSASRELLSIYVSHCHWVCGHLEGVEDDKPGHASLPGCWELRTSMDSLLGSLFLQINSSTFPLWIWAEIWSSHSTAQHTHRAPQVTGSPGTARGRRNVFFPCQACNFHIPVLLAALPLLLKETSFGRALVQGRSSDLNNCN